MHVVRQTVPSSDSVAYVSVSQVDKIHKILRVNYKAGASKADPSFPFNSIEVQLRLDDWTDDRIGYIHKEWMPSIPVDIRIDWVDIKCKSLNKDARKDARQKANAAAYRRSKMGGVAGIEEHLLRLLSQLEDDENSWPANLLRDADEVGPNESHLKGRIDHVCCNKFLSKTSHDALEESVCASCFERHRKTDMVMMPCSEDTCEVLQTLVDKGKWSQRAIFEFPDPFSLFDGTKFFIKLPFLFTRFDNRINNVPFPLF